MLLRLRPQLQPAGNARTRVADMENDTKHLAAQAAAKASLPLSQATLPTTLGWWDLAASSEKVRTLVELKYAHQTLACLPAQ